MKSQFLSLSLILSGLLMGSFKARGEGDALARLREIIATQKTRVASLDEHKPNAEQAAKLKEEAEKLKALEQ